MRPGNPWWRLLDYSHAAQVQARSVFRRSAPRDFAAGDPGLPAVVLLPGVYETWLFLEPAAEGLRRAGYRVFTVPALGFNHRSVPESAARVRRRLVELGQTHGVEQCLLLAHSKGGLIGKHAMLDALLPPESALRPEGPEIRGMVAINTPFAGSVYARYLFPRALRQFSPGDAVVLSLQAQVEANGRITSIFPEFDPHIPGGSALAGGTNVRLPVSGHFRTLKDPLVLAAVSDAVATLAAGR